MKKNNGVIIRRNQVDIPRYEAIQLTAKNFNEWRDSCKHYRDFEAGETWFSYKTGQDYDLYEKRMDIGDWSLFGLQKEDGSWHGDKIIDDEDFKKYYEIER